MRVRAQALALLLFAAPAQAGGLGVTADEPQPVAPAPAPAWTFNIMPYVWATGMSGSLTPVAGGPTIGFDSSISDTLEAADGALFLSFGAEKGRFVVIGDVSRVQSSRDGTLPGGIPAEGSLKQITLSLAAGYRIHADTRSAVDVFGGFRAFDLRAEISAAGGLRSVSPSKSFVDPIVGVRAVYGLSPRWSTVLYADVGGFGVGSRSAIVASALLNYRVSDRATVTGGYRGMWIDYGDGGTRADVALGGPILGVNFRF